MPPNSEGKAKDHLKRPGPGVKADALSLTCFRILNESPVHHK